MADTNKDLEGVKAAVEYFRNQIMYEVEDGLMPETDQVAEIYTDSADLTWAEALDAADKFLGNPKGTWRGKPEEINPANLELDADLEAGRKAVIDEIVKEVREGNAPIFTRNDLAALLRWLNTNTDIFDVVMVQATIELSMEKKDDNWRNILKLDDEMIENFVLDFAHSIDKE